VTQPESTELAKLLAGKFIERRDVKAVQTKSGAYMPVRQDMKNTDSELVPWSLSDLVDHVEGRHTYGHYLVSTEGTCRVIVFDVDLRAKAKPELEEPPILWKGEEIDPREVWSGPTSECKADLALQLRVVVQELARNAKDLLGAQVMVAYSGNKGMHTYVCLDRGTPAAEARDAAVAIFDSFPSGLVEGRSKFIPDRGRNFFKHEEFFPAVSIEVFPKQDEVKADGFGNLVRLPLGINQKSGKPGFFLDMNTPQTQFKIDDPMLALTQGSIR